MKTFRTLVLTAALVLGGVVCAHAQISGGQRIVYVDSEYIMNNIPEYGDAQSELEALSTNWQKEVKAAFDKVDEMYKKYQTEKLLLSEDQKQAREQVRPLLARFGLEQAADKAAKEKASNENADL